MPRPPSITYPEFKKVAVALTAEGKKLTFQALRQHVGGVSHDVLKRYLDQFQQERGLPNPGMPETVLSGAHALYEQARQDAREEVQHEYEVLTQALEVERQELQDERLNLTSAAASAAGRAEALASQVELLQSQNQRMQDDRDQLRESLIAQQERHMLLLQQYQTLNEQLVNKEDSLRELFGRYETALANSNESAREVERRFLKEQDLARQSVVTLTEESKREMAKSRAKLDEALQSVAQWKERAEGLQRELNIQASANSQIDMVLSALSEVKSLVTESRVESSQSSGGLQECLQTLHHLISAMGESVNAMFDKLKQEDIPK